MNKKKLCIIGCGTYGSYLLKRLLSDFNGQLEITVVEIGDKAIKTEAEIGITSKSPYYQASKLGRYFGLGGTSARWGGQILFFDERDNANNDPLWNSIIQINNQYKNVVLKNTFEKQVPTKLFKEDTGKVKVGVWLKYGSRNLFKNIDKEKLKKVNIIENVRVTDFEIENGVVLSAICRNREGILSKISADVFYLTSGAIESCRILLALNAKYRLWESSELGKNVGDHLSVELCKVFNTKPILDGIDFRPSIYNGHLITKRLLISSADGRMGYLHLIFNKEVNIFSSIKSLLFGRQNFSFEVKSILAESGFLVKFIFNVVFLHKLYVFKNNWRLQLDIEQDYPNGNTANLDQETDGFGQQAVNIKWKISEKDKSAILELQKAASAILKNNKITFESTYNSGVSTDKIEDVYHPVGFITIGLDEKAILDMEGKVQNLANLFHFSTAMFKTAKSINPTAAALCHIEYHLDLLQKSN